MKKYFIAACSLALMFILSSCEKEEKPMTPDEQKAELQRVASEMDKTVDESTIAEVKSVSSYYAGTLSNYNSTAITLKAGNIVSFLDEIFKAFPDSKSTSSTKTVETKGLTWSISANKGEFQANASTQKWEYVGEGTADGITLRFSDDQGREYRILISVKKEYLGILKGTRAASMKLYKGDNILAEGGVVCEADGITDMKTLITASYGPVISQTVVASESGTYSVSDLLLYNSNLLAECTVYATGVNFSTLNDVVSSFSAVRADVNLMNEVLVRVAVNSSIPDLFITDWSKSYVEKLQEYIDKNVSVAVYFAGHYLPQAEVRLRVDKTGAPLFGKICVTPYVYFEADGSTWEFDEYFESSSYLPDILKCLEDLLGNVKITY